MPSEDAKPVKKREEVEGQEGDDNKSLSTIIDGRKKKPTNNVATSAAKSRPKEAKVKKEETEDYDSDKPIARRKVAKVKKEENNHFEDEDDKPLAKRTSNTKPNKDLKIKKKKEEEKKTAEATTEQKKREKKVFDLPGQKRDPPEERDPLRIFYETLYEQVPHSEMAQFWMMECGLLSKEEAKKAFEKKQKKSQQQRLGTPTKTAVAVKSTKSVVTVKRKTSSSPNSSNKKTKTESKSGSKQTRKRKIEDESPDDDSDDDSDDDFVTNRLTKKKRAA